MHLFVSHYEQREIQRAGRSLVEDQRTPQGLAREGMVTPVESELEIRSGGAGTKDQAAAADFAHILGGVNSIRDRIQLGNGAMGAIARRWPF